MQDSNRSVTSLGDINQLPCTKELVNRLTAYTPTVVLIEDDDVFGKTTEILLNRRYKLKVVWLKDGEEACRFFEEKHSQQAPPGDIILLDLKLPLASGVQVLRLIKKYWPSVPVVVITAYISSELATEALHLGVVGLHGKPVTDAQIREILETYRVKVKSAR